MKKYLLLVAAVMVFSIMAFRAVPAGVEGYPDWAGLLLEIDQLKASAPDRVQVTEYGKSVEGRPLLAIHIVGDPSAGRRPEALPEALVEGNIHGNEVIGDRMAMAVAWRLVQGYKLDTWITGMLDRMEFWVIPCINPDGFFHTMEMMQKGDKEGQRKNAHGVDLNRNFPRPGHRLIENFIGVSTNPDSVNYQGPSPLSEPETRALMDFLRQHQFFVSFNYHSVTGVIYPARCTGHACAARHYEVGRSFSKYQFFMKYRPIRVHRWLDVFTGELEDIEYHELGALAFDVEIGKPGNNRRECECKDKFWLYNPKDMLRQIDNDRDATLYAIDKAYHVTGGKPIPEGER